MRISYSVSLVGKILSSTKQPYFTKVAWIIGTQLCIEHSRIRLCVMCVCVHARARVLLSSRDTPV